MTKNMKKECTDLVSSVFEGVYGYKPRNIRSLSGDKPSESNKYLYNPLMSQYEGLLDGKGISYVFFIYFESKNWNYSFTPFNPKDALA